MEKWTYKILDGFWRRVHRWRRRTLHDKILIIITMIVAFAVAFSVCMLDSYYWMWALGTALVGGTWLLLFVYANSTLSDKRKENADEVNAGICYLVELPKAVGTLKINESFSISVYKKLPNCFHRLMAKILLGWEYRRI